MPPKNPPHLTTSQFMQQALAALGREGVAAKQKTAFHLKVGPFNYYPAKGTIHRDGDTKAREETGLAAFIRLLRKAGLAQADGKAARPVHDPADFALDIPPEDDDFATY